MAAVGEYKPLRDYQESATRRLLPRSWAIGRRAPILVAPVGAGKTRMMADVAQQRYERGRADFWLLAHRRELIEQPWRLLRRLGVPATRVLAGESPDPSSPVHVASVQTLARRQITPCRGEAVVAIDEAHRAVGPSYLAIRQRFLDAYGPDRVRFVLLTATPYRLDGKALEAFADDLIEVATPQELFSRGLLVEPEVKGFVEPDVAGVPSRMGDFVREALVERVDQPRLVGDVVGQWVAHAAGAPSVYFASSIAHSQHLVERFLAVGVRAAHLDGETPVDARSRILARLAIGGRGSGHPEALDVVVNVDVLREGWDSESDYDRVLEDPSLWLGHSYPPEYQPLEVLGDCDPTQSCCAYRQREGRVCRPHPRKRRALILSHSGNWRRHGFLRDHYGFELGLGAGTPGDKLASRARVAVSAARSCPECLSVWPPTVETCPCGQSLLRPPEIPDEDASVALSTVAHQIIAPPNPSRERVFLRGLFRAWLMKNAERATAGKPPVKIASVSVRFQKRFSRWPTRAQLDAARAEAVDDAPASGV